MKPQPRTFPQQLRKAARRYLEALDTPRSLMVHILMENEEWDQIAHLSIDPRNYLDAVSCAINFARDFAATELLRKADFLPTRVDRELAAHQAFEETEKTCAATNARIHSIQDGLLSQASDIAVLDYLSRARKIVGTILGSLPHSLSGRFGPGSTFESRAWSARKTLTVCDKIENKPSVTPECADILRHTIEGSSWERVLECDSGRAYSLPLSRGNRFVTVPKSAKTDRGIAIEPGGNVYCQLGVGAHIRERLLSVGIDLLRAQEVHRELARRASITGDLATIDLSSASDTISLELVRRLVPKAWFDLLCALRSPYTLKRGVWWRLEKFSSMGNGFTFELETLIFYALCKAAGCESVSVYGDDIIIPATNAADVISALRFCGFTLNQSKSFVSGPFRESCGGNYFLGFECSPWRITKDLRDPLTLTEHANLLRESASRLCRWVPAARAARAYLIGEIPTRYRCFGPSWAPGVIAESESVWRSRVKKRRGQCPQTSWLPSLQTVTRTIPFVHFSPMVILASALLGVPSTGPSPRDAVSGFRVRWTSVS